VGYVKEAEHQHQLLSDRVHTMVASLANRLKAAGKDRAKEAELFNRHQNEIIQAAKAHAELITWEAFTSALNKVKDPGNKQVLTWLRDLYGFTLLEQNLAWYLINGRLSSSRAEAITEYIDGRLLPRLRPYAIELVNGFGLTEDLVRTNLHIQEAQRRADLDQLVRA
jgi:acyl-CoA oxidase